MRQQLKLGGVRSSVIHVSCRNVVGWESFLGPPEHGRLLPFLASGRTNDSPDFPSPLRVHATRSVRRVCPAYDAWSCYIHLLFDADSSFLSLSFVAIARKITKKKAELSGARQEEILAGVPCKTFRTGARTRRRSTRVVCGRRRSSRTLYPLER